MIVKLLTEHHSEFLSLKGGYRGSSESRLVKVLNCWKSYAAAHFIFVCRKSISSSVKILLYETPAAIYANQISLAA